jgi:WhiB family redox-sensing transcriptional regulator
MNDAGAGTPWRERAAYGNADPGVFFVPRRRERVVDRLRRVDTAKRICAACPVRERCLAFALAGEEEFGIRGGIPESERRRLLEARVSRPRIRLPAS